MVARIAKKSEITSAAIFHCTAKRDFVEKDAHISKGQQFYRINSDTVEDSYIVHWNKQTHRLECTCKCGLEHNHTVECKHLRAAQGNLEARKAMAKQPVSTPAAPLASYDVVGESLKVVNQALIDAKIGTFYEDVVAGEVKFSKVCGHRVRFDENSHCGCMA